MAPNLENIDFDKLPDYMLLPNVVFNDDVEWEGGKVPDYSVVDQLYEREKTKHHPPNSVEFLATNLIKNWEREAAHKVDMASCRTMDVANFKFSTNGKWIEPEELARVGTYNALIGRSEFYDATRVESSAESHRIFRTALNTGFALEVVDVVASPGLSRLVIKWRHWGYVTGEMKCPFRNGEDVVLKPKTDEPRKIEIFGVTILTLNEEWKISVFETYWNPEEMMRQFVL